LFYHRGSDCGIPPSLTTPCYLFRKYLDLAPLAKLLPEEKQLLDNARKAR
jgi:hypothetical protein